MAKHSPARDRSKVMAGNVKLGLGRLIGNQHLVDEGIAEVAAAQAEAAAQESGRAGGAIQEPDGTITQGSSDLLQSPGLSSEGHAGLDRGKRRKQANQ